MIFNNSVFKKNMKRFSKYLVVFFSIIASYVIVALAYIYFDNILFLSPDIKRMNSIYISIRTAILLAGIMLVVYQYYKIFETGIMRYGLRRTEDKIKIILHLKIWLKAILLMIITGMAGIVIHEFAVSPLNPASLDFIHDDKSCILNTGNIYMVTGAMWIIILYFGGYFAWKLDNALKKKAKESAGAMLKKETIHNTY